MTSGGLSKAEALACPDCRHACHVMLYSDTKARLFGRIPIRHLVLMQMRFDGLLGFPGGLVDPSKETLEEGLSRELLEELGMEIPVLAEDYLTSCRVPSSSSLSSRLITHFYVKKMEERQIEEVEKAAVSAATDHGQEVLGMVRVPLYTMRGGGGGGGLPSFLSHSFIGTARSQLLDALLRLRLVTPQELHRALARALEIHAHTSESLQAALAPAEEQGKRSCDAPVHV
ncbi:U8 snoRNA-decapping enzyme [Lampris incognitus]|uniref:U8 snoRNA-decapping enzyme n=1 Tax=Lampris incognitus TaxID=2546036 RepID=UPI0024B5B332|nr:U8 snoRNA-decapping enzyme [Lampris incognitus]